MRPVDDDLVGLGEPAGRGEHRAGRRRRSRGSRGSCRPGRPRPRSRSRRRPASAAWARTPTRRPASPRRAARRRARRSASRCARPPAGRARRRGPRRRPAALPSAAGDAASSGRTTSRRPSRAGSGCSITVATATGRPASMSAAISPSSGKVSRLDLLDEDVEDAAAGQADGERVVVGDAVALEHRGAGLDAPTAPARRRRPRRSRPRPSRPRTRRGRPASRRRAGAGRTGRSRRRCRRRRVSPASHQAISSRQHVTHGTTSSISSANVASEWPATKCVDVRAARRRRPACTGS